MQLAILTHIVALQLDICLTPYRAARHRSPSQPDHDRIVNAIESVISTHRLDMLGNNHKELSDMSIVLSSAAARHRNRLTWQPATGSC
jgi:hypothetical protein